MRDSASRRRRSPRSLAGRAELAHAGPPSGRQMLPGVKTDECAAPAVFERNT
jgi:hypothetical protein